MTPTPEQIVKAHQYLYYVQARPIWTDRHYDSYCRRNGLSGIGGSDRACDYSDSDRLLASRLVEAHRLTEMTWGVQVP